MTVARRFLADHRRSFTWWSVAMVAMVALTVALWPSIRGQDQFDELIRDLPDALDAAAELADSGDSGGVIGGVVATGSVITAGEVRMLLGVTDV